MIAPPHDFIDLTLRTLTTQGNEWSTAESPPVTLGESNFAGKIGRTSDWPQSNVRRGFVGSTTRWILFQIQLKKWFSTDGKRRTTKTKTNENFIEQWTKKRRMWSCQSRLYTLIERTNERIRRSMGESTFRHRSLTFNTKWRWRTFSFHFHCHWGEALGLNSLCHFDFFYDFISLNQNKTKHRSECKLFAFLFNLKIDQRKVSFLSTDDLVNSLTFRFCKAKNASAADVM